MKPPVTNISLLKHVDRIKIRTETVILLKYKLYDFANTPVLHLTAYMICCMYCFIIYLSYDIAFGAVITTCIKN